MRQSDGAEMAAEVAGGLAGGFGQREVVGDFELRVLRVGAFGEFVLRNDHCFEGVGIDDGPGGCGGEVVVAMAAVKCAGDGVVIEDAHRCDSMLCNVARVERLMQLAGSVGKRDVRKDGGVGFVGKVRTEADADVEGLGEVESDGRAELVHGLAFERDEECEVVAALFDADALGRDGHERVGRLAAGTAAAADAVLSVGDAEAFLGTLREVDHAEAVQGDDGFFGVVVEDPGG